MEYNYISIEGAIGAGKTTLAKMLAEHFNASLVLEEFEDNAFLPKFYEDPERYAFPVELAFLAERYQQIKKQGVGPDLFNQLVISDYFLGKSLIFASNNLKNDEYRLFRDLFDIMFHSIPKPDLLIYLYAPVDKLQANIKLRGRSYEQSLKNHYLEQIQKHYLDYLRKHSDTLRILVLDTSTADFKMSKADFNTILTSIAKPLPKGIHHLKV
jgi:deoxyadenosine/deoxycytidine kinase